MFNFTNPGRDTGARRPSPSWSRSRTGTSSTKPRSRKSRTCNARSTRYPGLTTTRCYRSRPTGFLCGVVSRHPYDQALHVLEGSKHSGGHRGAEELGDGEPRRDRASGERGLEKPKFVFGGKSMIRERELKAV